MRAGSRGYVAHLTGALLAGALIVVTLAGATQAGAAPETVLRAFTDAAAREVPPPYEDLTLSEVPHAVAVANDGTIAAALFNGRSIAILRGAGAVQSVPIGCSPSDVALAPDASTAWAVCQGDLHLYVIDVATGQVGLAGLSLQQADDVVYLPEVRRLAIADLSGGILMVDVAGGAYDVVARVTTGEDRPTDLAMRPDGRSGYAVTDGGALLSFTVASGQAKRMPQQAAGMFLDSLALSRTGTLLYGGAALGSVADGFRSAAVAIDPMTGATLQEMPLDFGAEGVATTIAVAPGYRSLTVATGLRIDIDGELTGLFDIALDDRGRMGAVNPAIALPFPAAGSAVSRSADAQRIAAGTVDARVVAAVTPNAPYPPTIQVQGRLKGTKLTLTGVTTGMQPGTIVTVELRDASKPKSRYLAQSPQAFVDARGAYRWTGTVKLRRVEVVTRTGTPAVSAPLTISRARR